MQKYVLLSMVAAALVGCGGGEESLELEGQEEVAPVSQEDESGRVTATDAACQVGLQWCTPPAGASSCVTNGRCSFTQVALKCASLVQRYC
jgi:hypothetical protein